MTIFKKIINSLQSPYPEPESFLEEFKGMLIASGIVGAILFMFRPFGMAFYEGNIPQVCLIFAGITLGVSLIYSFASKIFSLIFFPKSINHSLGRWILNVLGLLICIAIANVYFSVLFFGAGFSVEGFLRSLLAVGIIGIFPITFFGFRNQLKLERRNTQKALDILKGLNEVSPSEEKKKVILAIQSMENYVNIYTKTGNTFSKNTVRKTLQIAAQESEHCDLIKCHRSFLVNPSEVINVSGNAQGLKLTMSHSECPMVMVSRSYIEKVRTAVSKN